MKKKLLAITTVLVMAVTSVAGTMLQTAEPAAAATEDPYAVKALEGEVPTEQQNYMTDSQYKKLLGTDLNSKTVDAFDPDNTAHPLEGYQPTVMNELFLGYMNHGNPYDGEFAVMENVSTASEFNIDEMWNTNYGGVNEYYDESNGIKTMAINTIALTPGDLTEDDAATREQILIENRLYLEDDGKHEDDSHTMISTYTKSDDGSSWIRRQCKDYYLSNYKWAWDIMMAEQQSYTSMAVGDYDGDNYNEVAIYVPSSNSSEEMAFVNIYQPVKNGDGYDLKYETFFYIDDMGDRFNVWWDEYHSYVHLNTTNIAGRDDLVVNVTQPLINENEFTENGALAVWSFQGGNKKLVFNDDLEYDGYRFKMSASVNADLNGDGTDELVVGGFKNTGYSSKKGGSISDTENLVNVLLYEDGEYKLAWDKPQVTGALNLDHSRPIDSPVAMAAGRYKAGKYSDTVFLEGTYLDFTLGSGENLNEQIRNGVFHHDPAENMSGDLRYATINLGASGSFVSDQPDMEQVVFFAIYDVGSYKADADIVWGHANGGKVATDRVKYNYVDSAYEDDGTILTMCPVNVDYDLTMMQYTGKTVGWSNPVVYGILMSMPYWGEMDYGDVWNDRGETNLGVTKTTEDSTEVTVGVDVETSFSISGEATVMGNGMGMGLDFGSLADYAHGKTDSNSIAKELTWSSGAGVDSVALMVMPVVSYKYDVYIPEHEATQEEKKHGKSGMIAEERTTILCTGTYEPVYTDVPLETYNDVAEEFNAMASSSGHSEDRIPVIDMDKVYAGAQVGDPSSYASNPQSISSVNGDDYLYAGEAYAQTDNDKGVETLSIETSESTTESNGFTLGLKGGFMIEAIGGADFMSVVCVQGRVSGGISAGINAGGTWATTTSTGVTYSGCIVNVPSDAAGYGYEYSAGLVKWNTALEGLDENLTFENSDEVLENNTVIIGPTVSMDPMVPPALPRDLHILGVTEEAAVLEWTNPAGTRAADYYKIYYSKDDSNYYPLEGTVDGEKTRYLVTGLSADTEYYFKLEAYDKDTSLRSVKSAPVLAVTKAGGGPEITEHPEDCFAKVGETAMFSIGAKTSAEGNTLSYQWQQLSVEDYGISWQDINVASDDTIGKTAEFNAAYSMPDGLVREQDIDDLNGNVYRCVVAEHQSGKLEYTEAVSNTATLYAGEENLPPEVTLNIEPADGQTVSGDEIIMKANEDMAVNAYLLKTDGDPIVGEKVYFALMDKNQDNKCVRYISADTDAYGKAAGFFETVPSGQYEVAALVMTKDGVYRGAVSNSLTVTANETYEIIYELNGGINHNLNPVKYTIGSKYIILRDATREGYDFTGWYLDAELTHKVNNKWLDISEMTGTLRLYAGWKALEEEDDKQPAVPEEPEQPPVTPEGESESLPEQNTSGNETETTPEENTFGSETESTLEEHDTADKTEGQTEQDEIAENQTGTGDVSDMTVPFIILTAAAAICLAALLRRRKAE